MALSSTRMLPVSRKPPIPLFLDLNLLDILDLPRLGCFLRFDGLRFLFTNDFNSFGSSLDSLPERILPRMRAVHPGAS